MYDLDTPFSEAQENRWFASIAGLKDVDIKLIDVKLPGISGSSSTVVRTGDVSYHANGDETNIDDLAITFAVDVNYMNFFHVFQWLRNNVRSTDPVLKDINVMLLDNQNRPQGVAYICKDCFPVSLSEVELESGSEAEDVIVQAIFHVSDVDFQITDDEGDVESVEGSAY